MENSSTLYMLCGKMAAGKSTLAIEMSRRLGVMVIVEDHLLASLYPDEITDVDTYLDRSARLKTAMEPIIVDLLAHGASVILDFPANTVQQRAWFAGLAEKAKAKHELHYIEIDDSTCKKQLLKRLVENPDRASTDTVEVYDAITKYFEPPSADEGLSITHYDRTGS